MSLHCRTISAASKSPCVFDLLGVNVPLYTQMTDDKIAALSWDADLRLRPYISIVKAATRICGAISFAGIQSRHFNTFTCTLDATGVPPSSSRSLYFKHR
ncbi:MAG: hypothetical protein HON51_12405 [Gammaproteobacteria bacterium]|nr:hypothetical protein [Gammaproteobacteria bacterium]